MKKTSYSKGSVLYRLLLSIFLVFTLLGTTAGILGALVTATPSLLVAQLKKQDAAQKAYSSLSSNFQTAYNTTAVPASVYMDAISVDWLESAMESQLTAAYKSETVTLDYTALESSITDYFSQYAQENGYEQDDTYEEKLAETIQNGKTDIESAVDVYHIATLQKSGIWSKTFGHKNGILFIAVGCGLASIFFIGTLLLGKQQKAYWIGTSCFAAGVLLTVPTARILGSSVISHFALKDPAVYAVCTGTMTKLTQIALTMGILLTAVGLLLLVCSIRGTVRTEKSHCAKGRITAIS